MASREQIDEVFNDSLRLIEEKKVDSGDYMSLVVSVMELVEHYSDLDGAGKSDLGVGVVLKLVEHFSEDDPVIGSILSETTVRNLMKVSIDLYKGRYNLGKKVSAIKNFFVNLCRCGKQ